MPRKPLRLPAILLTAMLAAACATSPPAAPGPAPVGSPLAERVREVVTAPPVDQAHWGMRFEDSGSGRVLLEWNDHRKFVPASNVKVLVTAAALARLGPEHRFHTRLHAVGEVRDGAAGGGGGTGTDGRDGAGDERDPAVATESMPSGATLHGDLVLTGTGDPTLSARYWPDDLAPLEALADSVAAAGIGRVEGGLVVDASRWDSTTVAGTWMVSNLPWRYSATGGALVLAEGETHVVVRGGERPGVPAAVEWAPAGEAGFIVASIMTAPADDDADLDVSWLPERRRIAIRGRVPAGSVDTLRLATRDPVRQAAAALHRVLEARGVSIRDGWRVAWDPGERVGPVEGGTGGEAAGSGVTRRAIGTACATGSVPSCAAARSLADLASPPLMEVVQGILEPSQNWMSEQLVRYLAASDTTRASLGRGLDVMEETLVREMGVDSLDLSIRDGSGMSAYSLVTPRALVQVLEWARRQPWGPEWRSALAEPGEEGSTLSGRLPELADALHAKTGTISNVNALSGYLVTEDGRHITFSLLTNGSGLPSGPMREAMDEVLRRVAAGG